MQHVVEEGNPGVGVTLAGSIEVHANLDIGFPSFAGDAGLTLGEGELGTGFGRLHRYLSKFGSQGMVPIYFKGDGDSLLWSQRLQPKLYP